ncbi:MAG: RDD family protein [Gammaproteobacteria bacterium]|nr:RDD family protein [Gammaproteobacteria bacterium]MCF6230988.1 RDD family protein [Gammaproteobacteria bacterium]
MKEALPSPYASVAQRAAALLINLFLFAVVTSLLPLIMRRLSGGSVDLIIVESVSTGLFLLLLVFCWVKLRGSPGQLLMGCYVADQQSHSPISWKSAVVRALGYLVSFIPLGLGFLWAIWDKRHQGWHDKLAGTLVLQDHHHPLNDESQKSLQQLLKELR